MTNNAEEHSLPPASRLMLTNALADFALEEVAVHGGPHEGCPFIDDDLIDKLDPIRSNVLLPVRSQLLDTLAAARSAGLPREGRAVSMPKDNRMDYCCAGPVGSCTCASDEDFIPRSVSCSARLRTNCRPSPWPGIQTW